MPRTFIRSYPVTCLTIAAECNMFSTLFQMYHQIPSMLLHVVSAKISLILLLSGHNKKMLPLLHLLLCLLL